MIVAAATARFQLWRRDRATRIADTTPDDPCPGRALRHCPTIALIYGLF